MIKGALEKEKLKEKQTYNHYPRIVDSLCPECTKLLKAKLLIQEGSNVVMEKTCQEHGFFKEILSNDKDFYLRMEKLRFGDGPGILNPQTQEQKTCPFDCGLCTQHKSTTMMGVIDLTNKCNLKCPVCYATTDASGYVYGPSFSQVREMMFNLFNLKPAYTPCLQFSGGEPTLHPQFLDIIREARKIGFGQIQIATNGITLANGINNLSGEEFTKKASEAGLNCLYLQFDGVTDEIYLKTRNKPLFEIKKKAIETAHKYGIRTILVPTIVRGINNKQIGDIYKFAIENIDAVSTISWQPIALTGRIPEEQKNKMRFTLTDLAAETEKQFPIIKKQDWYPLSFTTPFSRFLDVVTGETHSQISCHAHCGIGTYLIVDTEKGNHIPLPRFVDVIGLMTKFQEIYNEYQKKKYFKKLRVKLNIFNYTSQLSEFYNKEKAPDNMSLKDFLSYLRQFTIREQFTDNKIKREELQSHKWRILVIAGMHFQDSYNYEVERSQNCVVHFAAPDGKLYPFCTYNAGPYFRAQIEKQFSKPLK